MFDTCFIYERELHAYIIVAIKTCKEEKNATRTPCLEAIAAPFSERNMGKKKNNMVRKSISMSG